MVEKRWYEMGLWWDYGGKYREHDYLMKWELSWLHGILENAWESDVIRSIFFAIAISRSLAKG